MCAALAFGKQCAYVHCLQVPFLLASDTFQRTLSVPNSCSRREGFLEDDSSIGSLATKRKADSPCHQDDASQTDKRIRCSGSHLPEDIWHHIYSLLPLKDAARAARTSRIFRHSWKCHPNLTFSYKTMGFSENVHIREKMITKYNRRVGHILKKHAGRGVKIFNLEFNGPYNANTSCCLDSWLKIAVTPGIEELTLILSSYSDRYSKKEKYNFPCSVLSNGSWNSIRVLYILGCAFRPTVGLGCMSSLTNLSLCFVDITGDALRFLLSNSFALEMLEVSCCNEIISIQIPFLLQRLSSLTVSQCEMLQVIEIKAQNISSFSFEPYSKNVDLLLGESLRAKEIDISNPCALYNARTTLPSSTPNLETLTIYSRGEMFSTPMLPSKFLHLKYLFITVTDWGSFAPYDFFSLVSFLEASPCLETFDLDADMRPQEDDLILEDPSQLERIPGQLYGNLKRVSITKFCATKMLVKLACHILENTPSLECLTLDTTPCVSACSDGFCSPCETTLVEAPKALEAIRTHIEGKVPSTAKLNVLEPCNRCRGVDIWVSSLS